MILTLEVSGQRAGDLGAGGRKVFDSAGGKIGRYTNNDWVLPDPHVSGYHARVQYLNGQFFLEDRSKNGTFVNSPENRLPPGKLHPLQSGDRFYIDMYEIRVSIAADQPIQDPFGALPTGVEAGEMDPLRALGIDDRRPPRAAPAPKVADLAGSSPLHEHYRPPEFYIESPPEPEPQEPAQEQEAQGLIPAGYDPLADRFEPSTPIAPQHPARASQPAPAKRVPEAAAPPSKSPPIKPRPTRDPIRGASQHVPASPLPAEASSPSRASVRTRAPPAPARSNVAEFDFTAFLQGAGLEGVDVSPELARTFGEILKVVIAGLMDILRARERIKDEFRMRMTTFKPADNNPLKFSANVEDALHNLLVKRNPAFLAPVAAFEDAFRDARDHQLAMLAGVRIAYESMLREFEPQRLQEEFDRQVKASTFLGAAGRLRYWDLYREKFSAMTKDADSSFRDLFGDEFAKAYEEQFEKLRMLHRAGGK
jgi:type VI secretion system FHA domain protein